VKTVADLGERQIIEIITSLVSQQGGGVGIGDDCAVVERGEQYLLLTTDMVTKSTHLPEQMSAYQQGWFLVAINLSDIAAMGGRPLGVLLSLGLPIDTSEEYVQDLIRGADGCAGQYNTSILGGDTKENPSVTLCGTAVGTVKKQHVMLRKGMHPGDLLAVTGSLGKAGAGFDVLQHGIKDTQVLKGLLEPLPRIQEGQLLGHTGGISSCMDLSDGLSSSLYQLQKINHVGFTIQMEHLPMDAALSTVSSYEKQVEYALHFGGDYELLCTFPKTQRSTIEQAMNKSKTPFTVIGSVTKDITISLVSSEKTAVLPDKGYEHFVPRSDF
jgi:thiamine-monophosphate kinase